ncbi:MAG: hypothetical protein ACOCZF_02950 [Halorhodospira sp.]
MSDQAFPRTRHVQIGYSALEDRVRLRLELVGQQGEVAGWLPRRVLMRLTGRLNEALRRSHPATEGEPAADAVMALEHQAARSELAGQRQAHSGEAATAEGAAAEEGEDAEPEEPAAYLVTEARLEVPAGDQVLIGLLGHPMPTVFAACGESVPVAGLSLSRSQAHELLRMLAEQARQADWGLPRRLGWLARLRRG